jgi:glycosyltransferase involved in cell wall biosynthesis
MAEKPSWRIERELAAFDPALIHVQHEIGYFQPHQVWQDWLAFFENFQRPVVVTYHSLPDAPTPITDSLVSCAIVPSPIGAALLRSRVDMPVVNIEHAVDGPIEVGSQREPNSLVTFGFLSKAKGYGRILQAMKQLESELPDLTLTIVAALTSRWQSAQMQYFNELLAEIHQLGLAERVDVSCGFRTMREVKSIMRRKSLGVLHYDRTENHMNPVAQASSASMTIAQPSSPRMMGSSMSYADQASASRPTWEPTLMAPGTAVRCQSAALFRLWSCGVPTIVSKSQYFEVGEQLRSSVIEAADCDALAGSIRELLTDPVRYDNASRQLAANVTRTWRDVANDHVTTFERILDRHRNLRSQQAVAL